MKKIKKTRTVIAILITMMIFALGACGNDSPSTETDPSAQADLQIQTVEATVFVNGVAVPGAFTMSNNPEFPDAPTHIVLMEILAALNAPVNVEDGVVTVEGLNGTITFEINSEDYTVNGEVITLTNLPSFEVDGTIYVPIRFFRDAFGMNNAYFSGGTVQINNEERME